MPELDLEHRLELELEPALELKLELDPYLVLGRVLEPALERKWGLDLDFEHRQAHVHALERLHAVDSHGRLGF